MADYTDNIDLEKKIKDLQYNLYDKQINSKLTVDEEQTLKAIENKDWNSGFINKYLQGLTRGGSDEIIAYGKSFLNDPNRDILANALRQGGDDTTYSNYDLNLALEQKDLSENAGVKGATAEMGGAIAPNLLLGRTKLLKNVLNPKGFKQSFKAGGKEGLLYGFNTGRGGFGPRLQNAIEVGGISAPLAGTISTAVGAAGYVGKQIKNLLKDPTKVGVNEARKIINNVLSNEGTTAKDAIDAVIAGKDTQKILADIGEGTELAQLVRAIDSLDVASYNEAKKILQNREKGSLDRLVTLFTGNNKQGRSADLLSGLIKVRNVDSKKWFDKAFYNVNNKTGTKNLKIVPIDDKLNTLISRPDFKKVFNATKKLSQTKGKKFDLKLIDGVLYKEGSNIPLKNIPLKLLHRFKRGYDSELNRFFNVDLKQASPMQLAVNQNRRAFLNILYDLSPDLKTGSNIYSGTFDITKAFELGQTLPRLKTKGFQKLIENLEQMTKSEKEAFMMGAQEELLYEILDGPTTGGAFINKLKNNTKMKKVLKFAFTGNADLNKKSLKFDKFYAKLTGELDNKITNQAVVGNSMTSSNIAIQKSLTDRNATFGLKNMVKEAISGDQGKLNDLEMQSMGKEFLRILTEMDEASLRIIQKELEGGAKWTGIVNKFPRAFKTILNSPFSPAGAAYLGTQAEDIGVPEYVKGVVGEGINAIPF
tara:strand:+ start:1345 stop:3456 length:2112 start_codon:yes stop_codon:yes gene_type:complete